MTKPILLVIAGCNGSGKSSFSKLLAPDHFTPFDYDFSFLKFYNSIIESELKEQMAHNMAFNDLENQINQAITNSQNFCYETNFNSDPMFWPNKFKAKGYELRMIYLCLNSIDEAKRRVAIRVENGGHFVPEQEIQKRYVEGFSNLDKYYIDFESIDLFDTSVYKSKPRYIGSVEKERLITKSAIPSYLAELLPNITSL